MMSTSALGAVCLPTDATILDALGAIDVGRAGLCCLVDGEQRFVALLTDGDVRRGLLLGADLKDAALPLAGDNPRIVPSGTSRAHVLDLMNAMRISAVPELGADRTVVAIHTLSDTVGADALSNRAVIMAGGKGTRLGALTRHTPKPLMTVAGRPILEWIVLGLVGNGIRKITITVNHMADQITERMGDGSAFGCAIEYIHESVENPLGTAGSLTLLEPDLGADAAEPIIVLNGDLMVEFDARDLLRHHEAADAAMTMGTKLYQHSVPFGVIEVDRSRNVTAISEKPDLVVEVNAAIYCIDPTIITRLPKGAPSTMPELAQMCIDAGEVVSAWAINSEWIDVGTPDDLARAKGEMR